MAFSQTWLLFLYLYGVGGIAFLFGLFIILKSKALRINYQKHKTWLWVLFYGYLFYAAIHAIFIILAVGSCLVENIVGTNLDRVVILIYFTIVMGFGAYFGKYSRTTSDYFFGGRRFAWWLITISIAPLYWLA